MAGLAVFSSKAQAVREFFQKSPKSWLKDSTLSRIFAKKPDRYLALDASA
jgi:hypothetical protein